MESIRSFEPLKPFAPLQFEVPASFDLVKNANSFLQGDPQISSTDDTRNISPTSNNTEKKLIIPEVKIDSPTEQIVEDQCEIPEYRIIPEPEPEPVPESVQEPVQEPAVFTMSKNSIIFEELGYTPVQPLAPLDLNSLFSSVYTDQNGNTKYNSEIKDGNIRNSLKEIISDLDNYVERNEALGKGLEETNSYGRNSQVSTYNFKLFIKDFNNIEGCLKYTDKLLRAIHNKNDFGKYLR